MALSSSTACDYCSISTYERDDCAFNDLDLNRVLLGRRDKACAMLTQIVYSI